MHKHFSGAQFHSFEKWDELGHYLFSQLPPGLTAYKITGVSRVACIAKTVVLLFSLYTALRGRVEK